MNCFDKKELDKKELDKKELDKEGFDKMELDKELDKAGLDKAGLDKAGLDKTEFDAVVFDMDGVIFDSERAVIECWQELAEKYNISGIEEACYSCIGTTMVRTREIMKEIYGEDFPYDEYAAESSKIYHERYDGGRLPMKPGVKELLKALKEKNKKIALASSTRKQTVEAQLRDAGIIEYFDKIICGDMVKRSKPEPDIFLKACEELGVDPGRAYAIEDSFNGIRSAKAAGMRPIMVPDLLQPDEEIRSLTCQVLKDLNEVIAYLEMM